MQALWANAAIAENSDRLPSNVHSLQRNTQTTRSARYSKNNCVVLCSFGPVHPGKYTPNSLDLTDGTSKRKYYLGRCCRIVAKRNSGYRCSCTSLFHINSTIKNTWAAVSLCVISNSFSKEIFIASEVHHSHWKMVHA